MQGGRTCSWGAAPWLDYYEFSSDSPNGLLMVELVSGELKLGDNPSNNARLAPADLIPVAGDPFLGNQEAPTYASFRGVATVNDPTLNRNAPALN